MPKHKYLTAQRASRPELRNRFSTSSNPTTVITISAMKLPRIAQVGNSSGPIARHSATTMMNTVAAAVAPPMTANVVLSGRLP